VLLTTFTAAFSLSPLIELVLLFKFKSPFPIDDNPLLLFMSIVVLLSVLLIILFLLLDELELVSLELPLIPEFCDAFSPNFPTKVLGSKREISS